MTKINRDKKEKILRDMPLHVAGLLDAEQHTKFDKAIENSQTLQDAYDREIEFATAVRDHSTVEFDTVKNWNKLSARLHNVGAPEQAKHNTTAQPNKTPQRYQRFSELLFRVIAPLFSRPSPAFAAGAIVAATLTIGAQSIIGNIGGEQEGRYLTLSAPPAASENMQSYLVIFRPEATSQDILQLVESQNLVLDRIEAPAGAFIFSKPISDENVDVFASREDLIEFYAEIR